MDDAKTLRSSTAVYDKELHKRLIMVCIYKWYAQLLVIYITSMHVPGSRLLVIYTLYTIQDLFLDE